MKRILIAFVLALGAYASDALACKGYQQTETVSIPTLDAETLARLLRERPKVELFDANGEATRAKYGVIPGAKLLSHYARYDVRRELPADKDAKIVFYCGSTRCGAAEKAAKKALEAGYRDVSVMTVGIKGWTEAGKSTVELPKTS